jgi:predicted nucleic acid-binding protein
VIVLDASAAVEWLLQTSSGVEIAHRVLSSGESLHAPHLLDIEVAQVLRRAVNTRVVSTVRAREALVDLSQLRLQRYLHFPFLGRVWELRGNLTAYDAVYIALAETLGATLLTRDKKIALSPGHQARVEVI